MEWLLSNFFIQLVVIFIIGFVWALEGRKGCNFGHIWRKRLWLILGIRLFLPIPVYSTGIFDSWWGVEIDVSEVCSKYEADSIKNGNVGTGNIVEKTMPDGDSEKLSKTEKMNRLKSHYGHGELFGQQEYYYLFVSIYHNISIHAGCI